MGTNIKTTAEKCLKGFALVLCVALVSATRYFPVSFDSISSGYYSLKVSRIQATLEFLASKHFKGRRAGSPEEDLTAAFLASVFRRNGLQPAPTTGGPYIQEFDLSQDFVLGTSGAPGVICPTAFHAVFPFWRVLRHGGEFPWEEDREKAHAVCPDPLNPVVMELRRIKG